MLNVLNVAMLGASLWGFVGCGNKTSDPESFLWFSANPELRGELLVYKDHSFELLSPDAGNLQGTRRGQLGNETVDRLNSMFSDSNIQRYVENHQAFSEDCRRDGIVITWWQGITACWVTSDVTDPATADMILYVRNVHAQLSD